MRNTYVALDIHAMLQGSYIGVRDGSGKCSSALLVKDVTRQQGGLCTLHTSDGDMEVANEEDLLEGFDISIPAAGWYDDKEGNPFFLQPRMAKSRTKGMSDNSVACLGGGNGVTLSRAHAAYTQAPATTKLLRIGGAEVIYVGLHCMATIVNGEVLLVENRPLITEVLTSLYKKEAAGSSPAKKRGEKCKIPA